jgi:hypothetical protein
VAKAGVLPWGLQKQADLEAFMARESGGIDQMNYAYRANPELALKNKQTHCLA